MTTFKNLFVIVVGILIYFFISIIGIICLFIMNLFYPNVSTGIILTIITRFSANFIAGFFTGLITKKDGLLWGTIVSIAILLSVIVVITSHHYKASGGIIFLPKMHLLYPHILAGLLAPIGGYLGEKISYRRHSPTKNSDFNSI